jgi:lysophospholipase L1-like esterase
VSGPDAAYWATPARLPEILVGALLAVLLHGRKVPANASRLAAPSLIAIVAAATLLPSDHGPAYDGMLPLFAVCSAALVYSMQASGDGGRIRRVLSTRPFVATGAISYGLYLFHWPVFVLLRERGWDLTSPSRLAVALAVTVAISVGSYRWVERPLRTITWRPSLTIRLAGTATAAVLVSSVLVAPGVPAIRADHQLLDAAAIAPVADTPLTPLTPLAPLTPLTPLVGSGGGAAAAPSTGTAPVTTTATATVPPASSTIEASAPSAPDLTEESPPTITAVPSTTMPIRLELPAVPSRPVRVLVVGDSTALYVTHGLAAWAAAHPDHAQVSVRWCQGCTFVLDAELSTFDVDGVLDESRRTVDEAMPEAIAQLRPDVVVLMATVSEAGDRRWSADEGALAPTDPRARERMVEAYAGLTMRTIRAGVPEVVWVVPPTPTHFWDDHPEMSDPARYQAHHEIIREAASRFEHHVSLVDLDAWVTAAGVADDPSFRGDGVHINEDAATDLAETFLGPWLIAEALRPQG